MPLYDTAEASAILYMHNITVIITVIISLSTILLHYFIILFISLLLRPSITLLPLIDFLGMISSVVNGSCYQLQGGTYVLCICYII